jgi:hypothetical protein
MRLIFSGVGSESTSPGALYNGSIAYFAGEGRGGYGIALDRQCNAYVLYRGGHVALEDGPDERLETLHAQAIAYHALTGSVEGFPEQELDL